MTPQFREMILGDDLTPVGRLSSAFLSPKTPMHMQFAYFQSSLVVEFLVNRFGFESLKQILQDLGEGISINQAIANRTAPIDTIEKEFAAFARDRANKLAPGLDWVKPDLAVAPVDSEGSRRRSRPQQNPLSPGDVASFPWKLDPNSTNYWQLLQTCQSLVREKKWTEAKAPLQRLIDLFPEHIGAQNAYEMLAAVYRALNETEHEREVLAKLAALDDAAPDAYLRLIELGTAAKDWPEVELNAERFLAVNPLISPPHRTLALASAELGKNDTAIRSYQRVLLLDPPDPAEVHYRLAQILHKTGAPTAKRQVLQALEEAPRFAAAQQLLLQITTPSPTPDKNPTPTPDGVPNNP
jgi:tetratricopeptide (TPR) repeat protein